MASPLLKGVLGTNFQLMLQEAEQKKSRLQTSHPIPPKPKEKVPDPFDEAANATPSVWGPSEALGAIHPALEFLDPTSVGKSMAMGAAGIFGKVAPDLLDKLIQHPRVKERVLRMQEFLKGNPDRWQDEFVHDPTTGRNYFQDMRGELIVEYPDVVEGRGAIGKQGDALHSTPPDVENSIYTKMPGGVLKDTKYVQRVVRDPRELEDILSSGYVLPKPGGKAKKYFTAVDEVDPEVPGQATMIRIARGKVDPKKAVRAEDVEVFDFVSKKWILLKDRKK